MTWVRLDDGFCDHPKIALLPIKSRWVYLRGLCYCNRYLTDGEIPVEVAVRWEGAGPAATLFERGLWTIDGGIYTIVGYLDWNPTKADVEERRRVDAERKAQGKRKESERNPSGIRARSRSGVEWSSKQQEEWFALFWAEIPNRVGKRTAETAFGKALERATPEEIIAGAKRYNADPRRDPAFTAHPTTWLNRDGWLDEAPEVSHPLAAVPEIDFDEAQRKRWADEDAAIAALGDA